MCCISHMIQLLLYFLVNMLNYVNQAIKVKTKATDHCKVNSLSNQINFYDQSCNIV